MDKIGSFLKANWLRLALGAGLFGLGLTLGLVMRPGNPHPLATNGTSAPTSATVAIADSTQQAISQFDSLSRQ